MILIVINILFIILNLTYGGSITGWDINLDYSNRG